MNSTFQSVKIPLPLIYHYERVNLATPHYLKEEKTPSFKIAGLSKQELITLNKNLQTKLKELEKSLVTISRGKYMWEATFDAIGDPVMIVNENYDVERANLSSSKISGNEITKFPGKKCYKIFANRTTPCPSCPLQESIEKGLMQRAQLNNKISTKSFNAYAHPHHNEKGGVNSCVMYYRDITEEQRLKREVVQQEKMAAIGMLAGGVAHEINNPLGGILAFTQLLLKKQTKGSETYEDLHEVEQAAIRCKKIVQDLLDFSRVSKEKEKCVVSIKELIEKVLPFVQMEIRSLNIELEVDLKAKIPKIMAVPNSLQQVFINLLTNACHAMPKGGKLTISMKHDEDKKEIHIIVQDTGVGMSTEVQERIFEPFFTTKDPGKGTGLGLSICYRIIKENEGQIDVQSEPGKGTTVTIRLPEIV